MLTSNPKSKQVIARSIRLQSQLYKKFWYSVSDTIFSHLIANKGNSKRIITQFHPPNNSISSECNQFDFCLLSKSYFTTTMAGNQKEKHNEKLSFYQHTKTKKPKANRTSQSRHHLHFTFLRLSQHNKFFWQQFKLISISLPWNTG